MGRSRGGLTTKIHALVDAVGRPILLKLTEGQAHDGRSAADMLDSVSAGQTLLADRAYDSDGLRDMLAERRAVANIRLMPNRKRLPEFDAALYKKRNHAERFFSKIKHFRAVATRFPLSLCNVEGLLLQRGIHSNRTVRHEWLDQHIIESIEEAQSHATQWLVLC